MAFDPEEARQYLEGVDYPANKEEIVNTAESNDAPEELLDMLGDDGSARVQRGRGYHSRA